MIRDFIIKHPVLSICGFLLFLAILSEATSGGSHENKKTETATTLPTSVKEKSLFTNAETFKQEFNAVCRAADLNFRIERATMLSGDVYDGCTYRINDNLSINAIVNKADGTIKEIYMIGMGDGSFESGGNMVLCMVSIIAVTDPSLTGDERMNVLRSLHLNDGYDISDLHTETYRNGIKYYAISSTEMGLWFGATKE